MDGLLTRQKQDFADAWRFVRGASGLENDVGEFARQLGDAVNLAGLLDIVPVLKRRNRDLMFSDLLNRLNSISPDEQNRLAALWQATLKDDPLPASLSELPALKAHAAGLLKSHLQKHYLRIPSTPPGRIGEFQGRSHRPGRHHAEPVGCRGESHRPRRRRARSVQDAAGKETTSLRTTWIEGERARMKLQAYVARLSGDFLDARGSTRESGYRRIEHLLKYPSAQGRPLLDGYRVQANYLMLGGTDRARNGVSIDEVSDDPAATLLFYSPQALDGKAWRELAGASALESLLQQPGWKDYCIARAARNEQWDPAKLFARQAPKVRYFAIEGDLFNTLYEARVKHLIGSVEYFAASNQRVDRDTFWYWIKVGLRVGIEVVLGVAALPFSLPVYLYGLANVSQALALGHYQEATDALIETLVDIAAPLPLQAFKPLLRQIRPLPGVKISRLIKTTRTGRDGIRQPLLTAEPSTATPLRPQIADLSGYEVKTLPELDYLRDGLFVDRTPRKDQFLKLDGKWYRTGYRGGKRWLLKEHQWTEDIELVRFGDSWQPQPIKGLRGGAPELVGTARYEVEATHRGTLDPLIRTNNARLNPSWFVPSSTELQRQASSYLHQLSRRLLEDAESFFAERPATRPGHWPPTCSTRTSRHN